jgi:HAD superfamily hydrolase (TIGR01509 family)
MKGAIFDIDGTLLDSMPIWNDLGARYLEMYSIQAEENLGKILFPMTMEEAAEYMKTRYHLPQTADEIVLGVLGIVEHFYRYEVGLKPGVETYVRGLHRKGIPMILATTGDKELATAALTRLGVMEYFCGILTVSDLGTSKHEPDIYRKAADMLQVQPGECVVFEDVFYALETAKAAGFLCAGVKDAASADDWERLRAIADYWIEDFTETGDER